MVGVDALIDDDLADDEMADVPVALIVALSSNRCIGRHNKLPWHLPNDLKYFKRTTMGCPIIMGRKTWESLGRALPGRTNIVITRQPAYQAENARVVTSLDAALRLAQSVALIDGAERVMVIGGGEIFAQALPQADYLYLTEVHADVVGDVFFPVVDMSAYEEETREDFAAAGDNPYDYSFVRYRKLSA